jgi:polyisoprenoid-binding protein YceI
MVNVVKKNKFLQRIISCSLPALLSIFLSNAVFAAVPAWQIVPANSSISFKAIQNNSPVTGEFKKFTGDIHFDPQQLAASSVNIVVDMTSVRVPYALISDTLKTKDWFDVKDFPQATFKVDKFLKMNDNSYQAKGMLTMRGKTLPMVLDFTLEKYGDTQALVKGKTTLLRTQYGIGQGEWLSTKSVQDLIEINFILEATKSHS